LAADRLDWFIGHETDAPRVMLYGSDAPPHVFLRGAVAALS
jgi:hypothetical protein